MIRPGARMGAGYPVRYCNLCDGTGQLPGNFAQTQ